MEKTPNGENTMNNENTSEFMLKAMDVGVSKHQLDESFSFLWGNEAFYRLLGYTEEEFLLYFKSIKQYGESKACNFDAMIKHFQNAYEQGRKSAEYEMCIPMNLNGAIWVKMTGTFIALPEGAPPAVYLVYTNLNDSKLKHIAEKDALTGIYNRAETEKQIEKYLLENTNASGVLFMIDTDNFKQINDINGHLAGDMVLAEMADGMRKLMRKSDIVGRLGGDEFIIFMKNISSPQDAKIKAEELLQMFRRLFQNEKSPISVTCSMGGAISPRDGRSFKEMYAKADKALYQAKLSGKNNFVLYDPSSFSNLENIEYQSARTEIESEKRYSESSDNLSRYIFRILYQTEDINQTINMALEIVGKQFDVSRAYVFENSSDGLFTSNTFEWCNDGISPEIDNLQNCSFKEYGDYEKLFGEDSIFYCRDIHTLKPEQTEVFAEQGIHSTLQCAFGDEDTFRGFVGFDECTGLRLWTQEEVATLSLISQILSVFLLQKKMKRQNQKLHQYRTVLNCLDECIYIVERESSLLLYSNKKFKDLYPECEIGTTFEIFHSDKIPITWDQKDAFLCIE